MPGFQMVNARTKVANNGTCMYNLDEDTQLYARRNNDAHTV